MLHIAICDDTDRELENLCLNTKSRLPSADVVAYSSSEKLLYAFEDGYRPDIAILDICMDGLDGIELAKKLAEIHPVCRIIFVSNHLEYAPDVYAVTHSYFVLKNQLEERLAPALHRAVEEMERLPRMSFMQRGKLSFVNGEDVLYLERKLRKTYIHCRDGFHVSGEHGKDILERSCGENFCRCHNSFWVNINSVSSLGSDYIELENGSIIPVSRSFRSNVRNCFFSSLHRELESATDSSPAPPGP